MRGAWKDFLLLIVLVPVLVTAGVAYRYVDRMTRENLAHSLRSVLVTSQNALRIWSKDLKIEAETWAELPEVREVAQQLLRTSRKRSVLSPEHPTIRSFRAQVRPLFNQIRFVGVLLIAPDGRQLAGMLDDRLGDTDVSAKNREILDEVFKSGTAQMGMPFYGADAHGHVDAPELPRRSEMIVAAPVFGEHGKVIMAFALVLPASRQFTQVAHLGRIGTTGETYAFNREGLLLTESRFDEQLWARGLVPQGQPSVLKLELRNPKVPGRPLTRAVQDAVAGRSGVDADGYLDYRGIEVIGAWLWDEQLRMGLVTEIDAQEAFAPLRATRLIIASVLFVSLAGGLFVSAMLLRRGRSLKRALAIRDEFVSVASHELKTPLTPLRLILDSLKRMEEKGHSTEDRERVQKLLNIGRDQVIRLQRLVEELLDVSRIRTRRFVLRRESMSLGATVRALLERFQPELRREGCELELEIRDELTGNWDRQRLEQVIENLLSNALKYGKGKPISILLERRGALGALCVEDHGIGIPEEDQSRIFDRFERAVKTESFSGLGLGLYVSRSIVEAHGGKISVASELGQGSVFTVELPLT